ncbi:putative nucleotidyltransferase substrate binding domain-containing protein [Stutzerimonas tarimensis]|uniref:Nucleotidyltransferase substrate binding domain-containing protein n=1 Tax=Stutzerimonas tarimensis TaxID=1507735 RepID=A0ABV7T6F1_9GAMM
MSKANAFAEAGKTAVLQNIHGTMDFLQKYPPFNQMEKTQLAFLVENCQLRFYAQGDCIVSPEDGPVEHFYIVKQGRVHGQRPHSSKRGTETTFEVIVGECFPMAALMGERATRTAHLAAEDTFCLALNKTAFVKLVSISSAFREFAIRGVSSLLDLVNQQAQMRAVESLGEQYSLETKIGELALHHPVSCSPELPLATAIGLMHEQNVGSIVIVVEDDHPRGIFTLRDLRRVIGTGVTDLTTPISEFMTREPFWLPPDATAFDAAIAMTERHIAHVCVVANGRLSGVISERDLFSLQRVDLVHLAQTIRHAERVDALVTLRTRIRQLVDNMLAHGASSTQITHIVTVLNDHTVYRVIELAIRDMGDPGVPFTWLCFGSEGRSEQTLFTDQDNGILFEARDGAEAAAIRGRLLPLAERINRDLDTCGFSLCKGNVMASNPELCLSRREWSRRFRSMVEETTPENLLGSNIYFDLRPIWGPPEGCEQLRQEILENVETTSIFQRLMAENALRNRPPVGRFRDFVVSRKGNDKAATLDLKVQGLTPFVDGARVLSLANGIEATNTLDRLRQLSAAGVIGAKDGSAYEEAYQFIQQTRMQHHQQQARDGQPFSNRLDPDTLNVLDRRILRESFRQAQRLQASLALRYQL